MSEECDEEDAGKNLVAGESNGTTASKVVLDSLFAAYQEAARDATDVVPVSAITVVLVKVDPKKKKAIDISSSSQKLTPAAVRCSNRLLTTTRGSSGGRKSGLGSSRRKRHLTGYDADVEEGGEDAEEEEQGQRSTKPSSKKEGNCKTKARLDL